MAAAVQSRAALDHSLNLLLLLPLLLLLVSWGERFSTAYTENPCRPQAQKYSEACKCCYVAVSSAQESLHRDASHI